jgi:uncharacterized membrane protein YdbT with pleckstrin-like domain
MNVNNKIFALEKPHPNLLKLYLIRSLIVLPLFPVTFLVLFFRYKTLRYNFDQEGLHMRWGILFRREINLTYSRIQDIHIHAGLIQRWLNLADIKIQTASGNTDAEMVIEGLLEYKEIRNFLYEKMRGYKGSNETPNTAHKPEEQIENNEFIKILSEATSELKRTREALECTK